MENSHVMNRLLSLFIMSVTLLTGCNKQKEPTPSGKDPHYNEVEELHIGWKDLFNQEDDVYYAYVYSVSCVPCSSLREQVTTFAKGGYVHFYFVYPSDDVPFIDDSVQADNSLGATKIEDVYCYSTPCLIEISDHVITKYTRDYYEIKTFVESYL